MAKAKKSTTQKAAKPKSTQRAGGAPPRQDAFLQEGDVLTTNQGVPLSDNHNSLKAGARGPTLLEDFILREKITSFDHERIPERVVHARGVGAFGYFECTTDMSAYTTAGFLTEVGKKTPLLARFSTVAGSRGSADTARDVRGFAVKFYTDEGNYDFVGNNIPVFFIQDAMKFPDLIHAAKPEQDLEIPQAQTAHDTFWDFASLMPESLHMLCWIMSDRSIPRSLRMMEGFGVHTFRFINKKGQGTFVKFHWKPKLGVHSLLWEESQQLGGLDPDYHRRDLAEAIQSGVFPEWELGVQLIPESDEFKFPFDLLDPTKLVPEELVPVKIIGRMVLDRNPDNYFTEIEQAAFHPAHLVNGIDFSNDPLLQGRLFSYVDTQITRLGGPNFHELPVNRPLAQVNNHQRDGFGRQLVPKGKVAYEPNSLNKGGCPFHAGADMSAFVSRTEKISASTVRARSPSFGDHVSQAQLFYRSQSPIEQTHMKNAFSFELSKVKNLAVRERLCALIMNVDRELAQTVAKNVGVKLPAQPLMPPSPAQPDNQILPENRSLDRAAEEAVTPKPKVALPKTSKALSIMLNNPGDVRTRKVALLAVPGQDDAGVQMVMKALDSRGVKAELLIPQLAMGHDNETGKEVQQCLSSTPSHTYDGVFVFTKPDDYQQTKDLGAALRFVGQAFKHCKTVGGSAQGGELIKLATAGMSDDTDGVTIATKKLDAGVMKAFIDGLAQHRHWEREDMAAALPY